MADNRNTLILIPQDVTNAAELRRFLSRVVETLDEAFLNQTAIADLSLPLVTASATYSQIEVQQISDQVQLLETTVNDILIQLRSSNIIQT